MGKKTNLQAFLNIDYLLERADKLNSYIINKIK